MSSSSSGKNYRHGHYGSNHYQKKGLFGDLFDIIASRSSSYRNRRHQYPNKPVYNEPASRGNYTICNKCRAEIPAGSKFCLQCGEKVNDALFCMNCGEKLPPNAKFCMQCGKRVTE